MITQRSLLRAYLTLLAGIIVSIVTLAPKTVDGLLFALAEIFALLGLLSVLFAVGSLVEYLTRND